MIKVSEVIRTEPVRNVRNKLTGQFKAVLLDKPGKYETTPKELVEAYGDSKEEAEANLVATIRSPWQGHSHSPELFTFRGQQAIFWRGVEGLYHYCLVREGKLGGTNTNERTYKEAVRSLRNHLAQIEWDGVEDESPYIQNEEDQVSFTSWARWQKSIKWAIAQGYTPDEGRLIADEMEHLISVERHTELGSLEPPKELHPREWHPYPYPAK